MDLNKAEESLVDDCIAAYRKMIRRLQEQIAELEKKKGSSETR